MQVLPLVSLLVPSGHIVCAHVVPMRFTLERSVPTRVELVKLVLLKSTPRCSIEGKVYISESSIAKLAFDRLPSLSVKVDRGPSGKICIAGDANATEV